MATTRKDYRVGHRVEIPAHYDEWMRGARYGVVSSVTFDHRHPVAIANVRMDNKSIRRLVRVQVNDLRFITCAQTGTIADNGHLVIPAGPKANN